MSTDAQARSMQIKKIAAAGARAVWGAFGASVRRAGEPPSHEDIQDMVAQPAADCMLGLQDLLPLADEEIYLLVRVLLAAGPEAVVGEARRPAKAR